MRYEPELWKSVQLPGEGAISLGVVSEAPAHRSEESETACVLNAPTHSVVSLSGPPELYFIRMRCSDDEGNVRHTAWRRVPGPGKGLRVIDDEEGFRLVEIDETGEIAREKAQEIELIARADLARANASEMN